LLLVDPFIELIFFFCFKRSYFFL